MPHQKLVTGNFLSDGVGRMCSKSSQQSVTAQSALFSVWIEKVSLRHVKIPNNVDTASPGLPVYIVMCMATMTWKQMKTKMGPFWANCVLLEKGRRMDTSWELYAVK